MEDITISKGWFKDDEPKLAKKKFCEHKANTVTLDYDVGLSIVHSVVLWDIIIRILMRWNGHFPNIYKNKITTN
ncbi:MAG: hypothetical protein Ct9H300mP23_11720 [Nitrospinota bacterium]|nr:MAG: hypothetical protein Ct9H300mP23_11720 [Nitrospinota bacterium]